MAEVYATLDDIKTALDKQTTADDAALLLILKAATKAIDNFCNRPDGFVADAAASARLYPGTGGPVLYIDECAEVTLVAVKDSVTATTYTAWAPGDWLAFRGGPDRPDFQPTDRGLPYHAIMVTATGDESYFTSGRYTQMQGFRPTFVGSRGVPTVQVTARWGYADEVPAPIREACIVQAARWFRRGLGQWSDTIGSPDFGQFMYRRAIDPAVQMILVHGRYKRIGI